MKANPKPSRRAGKRPPPASARRRSPPPKTPLASEPVSNILERVSDAFVALDTHWRYTYVNEQAARTFGRTREQMIGKHIWTEFPAGIGQPFYHAYYQAVATQQPVYLEEYYPPDDRWFEQRIFPSKDGLAIFFHDVTDKKRAGEAWRTSEARFRALIENATDVITILNADGTIRYSSPATEHVTGYAPPEIIGKNIIELIHPDDVSAALNALAHRLDHPGVSPVAMELRLRHRDGAWRTLETIGSNLLDDPAVAGIILNSRDITERKRAEAEIRRNAKEFQVLYETTRDLAAQRDLSALLQTLLDRATALLGAPSGGIYLYDAAQNELELAITKAVPAPAGTRLKMGEGMAGQVAQTREPLIVDDYRTWAQRAPQYADVPFAAIAEVPMLFGGDLVGVLAVNEIGESNRRFTEADVRLLSLFSSVAAGALNDARLFQETRRRAEELAALNALGKQVSRTLSLDEVITTGVKEMNSAVRSDLAFLFLREGEQLFLKGIAPASNENLFEGVPVHRVGECMCGLAVREGRAFYSRDIFTDARCTWEECKRAGFRSFAALPLHSGGEIIGVIGLASKNERDFDQQAEFLETLASQVAVGLQNARLYEQVQRHTAELEQRVAERTAELQQQYRRQAALAEIELAINQPHELQAALDRIAQVTTELLPASGGASVILWDATQETFSLSATTIPGMTAELFSGKTRARGGVTRWVVDHREPFLVPDTSQDPFAPNRKMPDSGARAYAAFPLVAEDQALGVLFAFDRAPRQFTQQDQDFLAALAARAALAISKVRLYASLQAANATLEHRTVELQQQYRRQAALAEIELAINQPHELQAALDRIAQATTELLPASGGASVILWDAPAEAFTISASTIPGQPRGTGAQRARRTGGATRWIVDHRQPLVVPDAQNDPFGANRMLAESGRRAYAGVPLLAEGLAVGVLYAMDQQPHAYTQPELDFMTALANRAAVAITKVRLYASLQAANAILAQRTAQLVSANKDLEAFSYSISHDLRAPLRAISGFAEIIAHRHRANLNEEGQHYFDNIVQASERMGRLIDDLLNYARLGRAGVRREPVPLRDVFAPLVSDLSARLAEIGGTLTVAADLPSVIGDKTLLSQVFTNLLENALTYRQPDVPAQINVSWQAEDKSVVIRVRDNGIGIPPEHHEKIFNVFQRLHSEDEYPGTGIGLATVKKSVELLGGAVWVESVVGEGSTFCVKLLKE